MKTAFHKAELAAANPAPSQHSETDPTCMICNGSGSCQTRGRSCTPRPCRSTSPCVETKMEWELRRLTQRVEELETENTTLRARLAAQTQPAVVAAAAATSSQQYRPPLVIKIRTDPGMPTRYICSSCNGLPIAATCHNPAVQKDRLGRPVCTECSFSDEACCMYCDSEDIQYIKETGYTICLNKECSGRIPV